MEVMLAIAILSIGMLGIAAMHLLSLKDNRDAYLRSQAILLTQDITERMRANKTEVFRGGYNAINTKTGTIPTLDTSCHQNGCSAEQIRDIDIAQWAQKLKSDNAAIQLLPEAWGTVVNNNNDTFTITITWQTEKWDSATKQRKVDEDTNNTYSIMVAF